LCGIREIRRTINLCGFEALSHLQTVVIKIFDCILRDLSEFQVVFWTMSLNFYAAFAIMGNFQGGVEKTSLEKTTGFNRKKPDRKTQAF
jgi:hypothetical protein